MMSSLYIGATGLKTHGEGLGVIGHNIANVNTIGFKQQSMLFEDIFYANTPPAGVGWENQTDSKVALSQVGMGARPGAVRTLFTEGPLQDGVGIFDMAIIGKGFFEVSSADGRKYYTRAGNFHLDNAGTLRDANNHAVTGIPIARDASAPTKSPLSGGGPVVIDVFGASPPKATSNVTISMNLGGLTGRTAQDSENPYFTLLQAWNPAASPPLSDSAYGYQQPVVVYDKDGGKHELTLYLEKAPEQASGMSAQYILAEKSADPAQASPGEGLYMAGTLNFSGNGQLIDMSAFTPSAQSQNLADWTPAALTGGLPQFTYNGQTVTLNLGVQAEGGWQNPPASAADVGTNRNFLPGMGQTTRRADATTALGTDSSTLGSSQDGYGRGTLMDVDITSSGVVVGIYSNAQNLDLYQIPVCRFTSEDGLRYEGNNLFSAPPEKTGPMTMGVPGTENYGEIAADHIEGSNVDLSREITLMIIMQRGFQLNSKTITTSDTMLQRAIELKRG